MSQYGFYREVQLATSLQAKVLVDSNGRLILNVENDVTSALVWNVESGIIDVNSEGRYNTQLAEWIANFGESQYSYIFNETNQYSIIADSDEEDIEYNDATGEWAPTLTEYVAPIPIVTGFRVVNDVLQYYDGENWLNVTWNDKQVLANYIDNGGGHWAIEYGFTPSPYDGQIASVQMVTNNTTQTTNRIAASIVEIVNGFDFHIGSDYWTRIMEGDESPILIM